MQNYALDVFNWIEVLAVQRPQIWRDECMTVYFIQVLGNGIAPDTFNQGRGV